MFVVQVSGQGRTSAFALAHTSDLFLVCTCYMYLLACELQAFASSP